MLFKLKIYFILILLYIESIDCKKNEKRQERALLFPPASTVGVSNSQCKCQKVFFDKKKFFSQSVFKDFSSNCSTTS